MGAFGRGVVRGFGALVVSCAVMSSMGCGDPIDPGGSDAMVPVPDASVATGPDAAPFPSNGVDILFVIDNSGSMQEEQGILTAAFDGFMTVLDTAAGGRPNVHIGIISTDMGAGPFNIQGCSGNGDNGNLQSAPRSACTPPAGAFIVDADNTTNYPTTIAAAFECISPLGITGCGFEQPLQSMRAALTNATTNAGFLRDDAALAVIILADEDDCSTADTDMFDTAQDGLNDPLGPLSSFRCFEFGVVCEPDEPRVEGVKNNCAPREDSQYMYGVAEYVDFLETLKPQEWLLVASISGPDSPVEQNIDMGLRYELEPSCTSVDGDAAPSIRLTTFAEGFDNNHVESICGGIGSAMTAIATKIAGILP